MMCARVEVTKNSSQIIGWTILLYVSGTVFNECELGRGVALTSAEEIVSTETRRKRIVTNPPRRRPRLAGPPKVHSIPRPPPPLPSKTSIFGPPPTPMMMMTGTLALYRVSSETSHAPPKWLNPRKTPRKHRAVSQ